MDVVFINFINFVSLFLIPVNTDQQGCIVTGKCHKSQRKNEMPHKLKVILVSVYRNSHCM